MLVIHRCVRAWAARSPTPTLGLQRIEIEGMLTGKALPAFHR